MTDSDWLSTEQAAEVWNHVLALDSDSIAAPVSANILRRLCRLGIIQDRGIDLLDVPGRWYISKRSLLRYMLERMSGQVVRAYQLMDGTKEERLAIFRERCEAMMQLLESADDEAPPQP